MIQDEHSMLAGAMNHATRLLATYAREAKFRLRREDYALPRERCGRIPLLAYFGDHMQLPPVPKKELRVRTIGRHLSGASRRSGDLSTSPLCVSIAANDALQRSDSYPHLARHARSGRTTSFRQRLAGALGY